MTVAERREYQAASDRDGGLCVRCGSYQIHIHHIVYRSHGGITHRYNLICLCKKHHDEAHSNEKKWKPHYLEVLSMHYKIQLLEKDLKKKNKWEALYENGI